MEIRASTGMLKILCLTLIIWLLPFTVGSAQKTRIADLRSEGWTEIERREEIKNFPGERPYENLTRVIQVIHFVFEIRENCKLR